MKYNFITVDGNTGAGKTTLTKKLQEKFGGRIILEEHVDNPFLPLAFNDPERYGFPNELYFLVKRYHQIQETITDYDLYGSTHFSDYLFVKTLLYAEVNLGAKEYELFKEVFTIFFEQLPQPELLVYVHSTVDRLVQNIQKRGRGYEQEVRRQYLQDVEDIYFRYFKEESDLRVLVINASDIDFVENDAHLEWIYSLLEKEYKPGITTVTMNE